MLYDIMTYNWISQYENRESAAATVLTQGMQFQGQWCFMFHTFIFTNNRDCHFLEEARETVIVLTCKRRITSLYLVLRLQAL